MCYVHPSSLGLHQWMGRTLCKMPCLSCSNRGKAPRELRHPSTWNQESSKRAAGSSYSAYIKWTRASRHLPLRSTLDACTGCARYTSFSPTRACAPGRRGRTSDEPLLVPSRSLGPVIAPSPSCIRSRGGQIHGTTASPAPNTLKYY